MPSPAVRGLCLAMLIATAAPATAGAQEATDSFADGDVLRITAYGREDLTGQYSVQPGPVVSLPLIGTVQLANRSARQLEADLARAWENRLGSPMSVNVEFSVRAPFYVIGAVNTPGAYPYRSGMTVLQAVAVSGGLERLALGGQSIRMDVLRERERRLVAIAKLARATARQARLEAERDGREQVTLATPFTLVAEPEMNAILAGEARLLDTRARQHAIRQRLLSDQIRLGETEIAAMQRQLDEMARQQGQIGKEVTRIRRIPGQQVRAFELDQRVTSLQTSTASINASIARSKVAVETARNGIADLQEARQREITEALLETQQVIRENELAVAATEEVLAATGQAVPDRSLAFRLVRGKDEVPEVMSTTPIRPGDLLDVSIVSGAVPQQTSAKP